MGLFNKVLKIISGNDTNLNEVNMDKSKFLKKFSMENKQLKDLELLASKLKEGEKKDNVNRNIYYQKQGIYGEKKVYFELKNTFLPIICLHDIRIEYEGYIAQLDFVVISSRYICVLEAKKLNGNIKIDSNGNFIRKFYDGNERGMYSPVSQNKRHIDVLKYVLSKKIKMDIPFESLVIIANEKSIVDESKAPENIKKCIVKYDGIASRLEEIQNKNNVVLTLENMNKIAKILIKLNKQKTYDNLAKFSIKEEDFIKPEDMKQFKIINTKSNKNKYIQKSYSEIAVTKLDSKEDKKEHIKKQLKKFRWEKSQKLKIKPYFVFNNAEMEDLLDKMPKNKTQLLKVRGFGEKKVKDYGNEILRILKD